MDGALASSAHAPKKQIPRTDGEQLTGLCKVWNVEKGYGFFECSDGGEDIFMHQSAVTIAESRFRAILPGTKLSVTFNLRDGKPTCTNICGENGTPLPGFESKLIATQMISRASGEPGSKLGKCKWFNAEKGFGFIVPDDGTEDVFVNIKDIENNQPLQQDDPVQYCMAKQADNRDRATKVKSLKVQQQPFFQPQQQPMHAPYNPYGQAVPPFYSPYGVPPPAVSAPAGPSGTQQGSVKWYNEDRGFGFIVPANGSTEVYFRGNAIQGGATLTEGDPVDYEEKKADGKVWAASVVSVKNRKRKNPGEGYGGYDPNQAPMFKAPRQTYAPAQPTVTQYDPYGNPVGQGVPPQQPQGQYGQYDAYPPAPAGGRAPQPGGFDGQPGGQQYGYGAPAPYY